MDQTPKPRFFLRRRLLLAGIGAMLALLVAGFLGAGLADPVSSLAAPASGQRHRPLTRAPAQVSGTVTYTLFLPFISHPAPIVPNVWQGEYYANAFLTGTPAYTTTEVRVDHDWGTGAPNGLPDNGFSIRWTGHWNFEYGQYTFFILSDDGVRLWLDDELIIDAWVEGWATHRKTILIEKAGLHKLKLEYFERSSVATVRLQWRRTDLYPYWQGDYYTEPWVESGWAYDQRDSAVQFDWGEGSPPGLPDDGFSVSWDATPVFGIGTHRIYLYADDGYQLYVDGNKVREGGWYDGQGGGSEDVTYDLDVDSLEHHQITYNFHDRGSLAEARIWIEYLEYPKWSAEYYSNMNLEGSPVLTKQESAIFYDWSYDKPYPALPHSDHFSVRWSGQRYFHAGCYRFGIFADDGVRLWVDGDLLIDEWHDDRTEYYSPVTYLETGYHNLVIHYYENAGEAEIRFWWE